MRRFMRSDWNFSTTAETATGLMLLTVVALALFA